MGFILMTVYTDAKREQNIISLPSSTARNRLRIATIFIVGLNVWKLNYAGLSAKYIRLLSSLFIFFFCYELNSTIVHLKHSKRNILPYVMDATI